MSIGGGYRFSNGRSANEATSSFTVDVEETVIPKAKEPTDSQEDWGY